MKTLGQMWMLCCSECYGRAPRQPFCLLPTCHRPLPRPARCGQIGRRQVHAGCKYERVCVCACLPQVPVRLILLNTTPRTSWWNSLETGTKVHSGSGMSWYEGFSLASFGTRGADRDYFSCSVRHQTDGTRCIYDLLCSWVEHASAFLAKRVKPLQ